MGEDKAAKAEQNQAEQTLPETLQHTGAEWHSFLQALLHHVKQTLEHRR